MYLFYGGGAINWASCKQEIVAHSSSEAESVQRIREACNVTEGYWY